MASKILFVDDEKDLEGLVKLKFRKLIHREDFSFSFASNGIEALKILEKEKDIVIENFNKKAHKLSNFYNRKYKEYLNNYENK